jgi:hypothetical protein
MRNQLPSAHLGVEGPFVFDPALPVGTDTSVEPAPDHTALGG